MVKSGSLNRIKKELKSFSSPEKARVLSRFFKTKKGEYGEGDRFMGVTVPNQRIVAKSNSGIELKELHPLMSDPIHECRLTALLILVEKYKKSDDSGKKNIFDFYMKNINYVNNWDLVDLSAPNIVGAHLKEKNREILYDLARSENVWRRRISIVATYSFIRDGDFKDTLRISEILLHDKHDLIHKAVGWMLREMGKRDIEAEESFLNAKFKLMPRTMLRYAIERFPDEKRRRYMFKN